MSTRRTWTAWGVALGSATIAVALAMVALALLAAGAEAQTDPPASGDWVVSDTTLVKDRTVVLDGNLTVTATGDLTLEEVDLKFDMDFDGQLGIVVMGGGSLTLKDVDHNPYTVPDATTVSSTVALRHYTWVCQEGSGLLVSASIVRNCGIRQPYLRGLVLDTDDARVENSTIWSCNFGLFVNGSSPVIEDCTVYHNDGYGIYVEEGAPTVRRCNFEDNYDTGAFMVGARGASFLNCSFSDHEWAGLFGNRSTAFLEDCTFENNTQYGVRFFEDSRGRVAGCEVFETEHVGIYLGENCSLQVVDNEVHDVTNRGIWVYTARPVVSGNQVHTCGDGMFFYDSELTVEGCVMEDNERTGVIASDSSGFLVANCTLRGNGNNGIFAGSLWTGASVGEVRGCDITGNGRAGVFVGEGSDCDVRNGHFHGNGIYAIYHDHMAHGDWLVDGAASAINETVRIAGDVRVLEGGDLKLVTVTLFFNLTEDWQYGMSVSGGQVNISDADGDRLTPMDASQVLTPPFGALHYRLAMFEATDGGRVHLLNSDLTGIEVVCDGGYVQASGCTFHGSPVGLSFREVGASAPCVVKECSFDGLEVGVDVGMVSVAVGGCTFSRCGVGLQSSGSLEVWNTTVVSCDVGLLATSGDTRLDGVRFLDCGDGINCTGSGVSLDVEGSQVKRSRDHGLRLARADATLTECEVSSSTSGGIVADASTVSLEDTSVIGGSRAGIIANMSFVELLRSSVTDVIGIGIWTRNSSLRMEDSYLGGSEAYDLRLEETSDGEAYNTSVQQDEVRALDTSTLVVHWRMRVVVGMRSGRPTPLPLQVGVRDALGNPVFGAVLTASNSTPWKWVREFSVNGSSVTAHNPYNVTVQVLGEVRSETFGVYGRTEHLVLLVERLDLALEVPEGLLEGIETVLDASGSVIFPYAVELYQWDMDDDGEWDQDTEVPALRWTFDGDGEHPVTLRVTVQGGIYAQHQFLVTVLDGPLEAHLIGRPPEEASEDQAVELEGGYTTLVDQVILLSWDFDDGATGTGAKVDHSWTSSGVYNVSLTVLDSDGTTATTSFDLTVVNLPPVASVAYEEYEVDKGEQFYLDGSTSNDTASDRGDLSYRWELEDGGVLEGAQVLHSYGRAGTYRVTLNVTDDDGAYDTAALTVVVVNEPPTVEDLQRVELNDTDGFVTVYLEGLVEDPDDLFEMLTLNASAGDEGIVRPSVLWDDGHGWYIKLEVFEGHDGETTVTLTVEDPDGGTATGSFDVTVSSEEANLIERLGSWLWVIVVVVVAAVVALVVLVRRLGARGG